MDTRRRFVGRAFGSMAASVAASHMLADRTTAEDLPEIFYDDKGLIVHKGDDGGDTAQREGWYWFGVWICEKVLKTPWTGKRRLTFPDVIRLLEPSGDGVFRRHPKYAASDKDWGFSRDQMVPLVAAMGIWGLDAPLRRLWNALPQDPLGGTKHTFNGEWQMFLGQKTVHTGDVVGPMTINLFRRAWNEDPGPASDGNGPPGEKELLANVGLRLKLAADSRDDTGDDLNLIVMLLMAALRFPSDLSRQIMPAYAKNRPVSYGSFLGEYRKKYGIHSDVPSGEVKRRFDEGISGGWSTDASRVLGAIRWYHRVESGANPRLSTLYEPIVRAYLE